jgi:cell division protease FtsH
VVQEEIEQAQRDNNFYGEMPSDLTNFLKNVIRKKMLLDHAPIAKGFLLYGPPGNGKSLSAKIIAETSGIPFVTIPCGSIITKWQGSGPQAIRSAFSQAKRLAKKYGHAVIFLDETDAIAQKRQEGDMSMGKDYRAALTTLLDNMDGIASKNNDNQITVIAATNRSQNLDEAFVRPGRIDKHIELKNPTEKDRLSIFVNLLAQSIFDVKLGSANYLAKNTVGFSAADCDAVIKNAENHLYNKKLDGKKFHKNSQ